MTPDPQTRAAMVEAAATALFMADEMVQFRMAFSWSDQPEPFKDRYRKQASAAITAAILAAEARGFKLVGPGATTAQIDALHAGCSSEADDWAQAHAVAPKWEDG